MSNAAALRAGIPFVNDLGVEFLAADAGRATIALQLHARHLNSWNVAHGGVIMTLLDVAMAVAGRSLDPSAGGGVTVEMKTSFVQPGFAGSRLTAIALVEFCQPRLPYFAIPRYVEFVAQLPTTESGKIQKFMLRERGVTETAWDRESAGIRLKREKLNAGPMRITE